MPNAEILWSDSFGTNTVVEPSRSCGSRSSNDFLLDFCRSGCGQQLDNHYRPMGIIVAGNNSYRALLA